MRRFKNKYSFLPHKVNWKLEEKEKVHYGTDSRSAPFKQYVFCMYRKELYDVDIGGDLEFKLLKNPFQMLGVLLPFLSKWGAKSVAIIAFKLCTKKRIELLQNENGKNKKE